MQGSTPSITEFDPKIIPFQWRVIKDIANFDYEMGKHEILLSGAVGSSKTLLMSHCIVRHCILYPGACVGIGRLSMPHLKGTLLQTILNHIGPDIEHNHNKASGIIRFSNGSSIIPFSWKDRQYTKLRSYEFSAFAIEELTENHDKTIYDEISQRVRLPHVKERWIMCATNPDDPEHWAYKYFITSDNKRRHVYYSITSDNPFLPETYIEELQETLDHKMARRMIYGEWLSIAQDVIYYCYDPAIHYKKEDYKINKQCPIHFTFDFNIAEGKPMSVEFFQYIGDTFHFFDEAIVHGADTESMMEEISGRGLLDHPIAYYYHGDATGGARSTKSKSSDYDIIEKFLSNYRTPRGHKLRYRRSVPRANPPVRKRHNLMNAYMKNANGKVRFYVYTKCKVLDEGCRLTKLKKGGKYIEDDSKYYQHCTTAAGYAIVDMTREQQNIQELDRWRLLKF